MYQKPTLYKTEDLAEGVYAASGSSEDTVRFTSNGFTSWGGQNGQINYSVTIPSKYIGEEHVILTVNFSKNVTGCWGLNASVTGSGKTFTFDVWHPQNGTIGANSDQGDPGLKSITIRKA